MKLIAVSQRGSRKDFVDLYFLGLAGVDLRHVLDTLPRKMPGIVHNRVHLARSLAYFADAESEPEPRMLVPFRWSSARDYSLARSRAILQKILEAG
jgi:ABC-type hemin transport system ATPase subunit